MPAAASGSIQPPPRNSTASGQPGQPLAISRGSRGWPRERTNHGGNWNSTAPSLPASASGASASVQLPERARWSRVQVAAVDVALAERLGRQPSRSQDGSRSAAAGCQVSRPNALTSKTKPSGVRFAQSSLFAAGAARSRWSRPRRWGTAWRSSAAAPRRCSRPAGRSGRWDQGGVGPGAAAHEDPAAHGGPSAASAVDGRRKTLSHRGAGTILGRRS